MLTLLATLLPCLCLAAANSSSGAVTTADGISLHYTQYGNPSDPTILFAHGYPYTSATWDEYMYAFKKQGYHTVAFDRRGFGKSSSVDWGYESDTLVADMNAVVEGLNLDNFTLIGHSMGTGDVIRYISGEHADRVHKAVLISTYAPAVTQQPGFPYGPTFEQFANNMSIIANLPQFVLNSAIPFLNIDPTNATSVALAQGRVLDYYSQASTALFTTLYEAFLAIGSTYLGPYLPSIQVPTLVIHGLADQVVPFATTGNITAHTIPNAQLKTFEGGSHALYLERPLEVQKVILDFLAEP